MIKEVIIFARYQQASLLSVIFPYRASPVQFEPGGVKRGEFELGQASRFAGALKRSAEELDQLELFEGARLVRLENNGELLEIICDAYF